MKINNIIYLPTKETIEQLLEDSYNKAKERYEAKHHISEVKAKPSEAIKRSNEVAKRIRAEGE